MNKLETKLEGSRIYLRKLGLDDATNAYCSWLNDTEVNQYLDTKGATLNEIKKYILIKNKKKDALLFGIFVKENNRHIGTIKLDPIDRNLNKATTAIMIGDKEYWGKGFGGDAIILLSEYGFVELGLQEIWLGVKCANIAAIKSYSKIGFKKISVANDYDRIAFDPYLQNEINMVLTRKEFYN